MCKHINKHFQSVIFLMCPLDFKYLHRINFYMVIKPWVIISSPEQKVSRYSFYVHVLMM